MAGKIIIYDLPSFLFIIDIRRCLFQLIQLQSA